jgi:hypothetical protein
LITEPNCYPQSRRLERPGPSGSDRHRIGRKESFLVLNSFWMPRWGAASNAPAKFGGFWPDRWGAVPLSMGRPCRGFYHGLSQLHHLRGSAAYPFAADIHEPRSCFSIPC